MGSTLLRRHVFYVHCECVRVNEISHYYFIYLFIHYFSRVILAHSIFFVSPRGAQVGLHCRLERGEEGERIMTFHLFKNLAS